jgi:hypothetical protein
VPDLCVLQCRSGDCNDCVPMSTNRNEPSARPAGLLRPWDDEKP